MINGAEDALATIINATTVAKHRRCQSMTLFSTRLYSYRFITLAILAWAAGRR
jgi:hypothetical protein